jgi:hypothetical protein
VVDLCASRLRPIIRRAGRTADRGPRRRPLDLASGIAARQPSQSRTTAAHGSIHHNAADPCRDPGGVEVSGSTPIMCGHCCSAFLLPSNTTP